MNISCAICSDLYVSSSIIYATACGHIFHQSCLNEWLVRSPTCPECRDRCRNKTFRIFINVSSNLDDSVLDAAQLSNKVTTLAAEIDEKKLELKKHSDKELKLKGDLKKSSKVIKELEEWVSKKDAVIVAYRAEISALREECKRIEYLKKDNDELKTRMELMTNVEALLASTTTDVDEILDTSVDIKTLAVTVASLKRELRASEVQKKDLRKLLTSAQNDLRTESRVTLRLTEKLTKMDKEKYRLKDKVEKLEHQLKTSTNGADISGSEESPRSGTKRSFSETTDSPSIPEKVLKIVDSTSPYLYIKSSIVGLSPLLLTKNATITKNENISTQITSTTKIEVSSKTKFSIFNPPRLTNKTTTYKSSQLVYNGYGGSERKEAFPDFPNRFGVSPRKPLNDNYVASTSKLAVSRLKMGKLSRMPVAHKIPNKDDDQPICL